MGSHPSRTTPLLAGVLGGVVSLGFDIDHLGKYFYEGPIAEGRPLHIPVLLGTAVFVLYRFAHTYRLLVKANG